MEVLVNMLRDISLFYVDDVDPDELLSDAAAGMTAGLDPYTCLLYTSGLFHKISSAGGTALPADVRDGNGAGECGVLLPGAVHHAAGHSSRGGAGRAIGLLSEVRVRQPRSGGRHRGCLLYTSCN